MGGDPGDELQVVHPLHLLGVLPIPVAEPAFPFIQGEPLQGQERADHVFAHPLGLFLCLSTCQAVNIEDLGLTILLIEPGSPWKNGYVESYIGKLRDELLNGETLDTLMEAKVLVEGWRQESNRFKPHSSLGYKPPAPETKWLENPHQGVVH
jgi:hypothetical protein